MLVPPLLLWLWALLCLVCRSRRDLAEELPELRQDFMRATGQQAGGSARSQVSRHRSLRLDPYFPVNPPSHDGYSWPQAGLRYDCAMPFDYPAVIGKQNALEGILD
jgi:hypothetical protein